MCRVLQVNRNTYYYEARQQSPDTELEDQICEIFHQSRDNYGTRKIKKSLESNRKQVSRRRIGRVMKKQGLVSKYTIATYKLQSTRCNESNIANIVDRSFDNQPFRRVVVSDLTYVRVGNCWNYICTLVDLFNREIIGYSAGVRKTPELVQEAFASVEGSLSDIQIFHTDRGNEFKNHAIDAVLEGFRSPAL